MRNVRIGMVVMVLLAGMSTTGQAQAADDRVEFNRLVHQRNDLYAQLRILETRPPGDETDGDTSWTQNQLDIVERRLADLAARNELKIPRRQVTTEFGYGVETVAISGPGGVQPFTPKQKGEFHKLVIRRNKLHAKLRSLDSQASDLIKSGQRPLVVHAQQVSVQDQLDLVELRLAILGTRHGVWVPPVPGRDPAPDGGLMPQDDPASRSVQRAFARGRDRAVKQLRNDATHFMASLDFWAFLNE